MHYHLNLICGYVKGTEWDLSAVEQIFSLEKSVFLIEI